ncbi:MAG: hypothetical protein JWQ09_5039 [Segetibacter sp.]|nr:hypothetical protein [Segetibacter sp.]
MKQELKGKIMIRKGMESMEPCIVYVSHVNRFDSWVTPKLNTGEIHFSSDKDLIEFDYNLFQKMFYEWKIKQMPKIKKRFKKFIAELNPNPS